MNVIFAPHLDDEIIGCFSILNEVDLIVYFCHDYREAEARRRDSRYVRFEEWEKLRPSGGRLDLYIPSQFDYHPLHRKVRGIGLNTAADQYWFYSVEMNVPWLEEEANPEIKRMSFEADYPGEVATINKSDKYFLFKSIKPFDEYIWASVKFQRPMLHCWPDAPPRVSYLANDHRHLFHFEVDVQQFGDDRDIEYLMFSEDVQLWFDSKIWDRRTSCEMFAIAIKRYVESTYPDRRVRVRVFEDGENGCALDQ